MAGANGGHSARPRIGSRGRVGATRTRETAVRCRHAGEHLGAGRQGRRDHQAAARGAVGWGTAVSRVGRAFSGTAQPRLITYATAGDPDRSRSAEIIRAMARGGADAIEIGVPFSDPIADGPAIQRASERALASGTTLRRTLELVSQVRADIAVPVVLFTYVNPVLRLGTSEFLSRAADAGIDGVLLLDLPIEESEAMHAALDSRGIDQIFLVSPTTTDERLRLAGRYGRGFLYAISRLGVTGARDSVAQTAAPLVERLRSAV